MVCGVLIPHNLSDVVELKLNYRLHRLQGVEYKMGFQVH